MTSGIPSEQVAMAEHPDLVAMREHYEELAETGTARFLYGAAFMAGAYAAISPWVVGFHSRSVTLTVNDLIVGIGVALLALGFASVYERTHGLTWVMPLMGVWLIISPWVVQHASQTAGTIASNVAVGACIVALGLCMLAMEATRSFHLTVTRRPRPQP